MKHKIRKKSNYLKLVLNSVEVERICCKQNITYPELIGKLTISGSTFYRAMQEVPVRRTTCWAIAKGLGCSANSISHENEPNEFPENIDAILRERKHQEVSGIKFILTDLPKKLSLWQRFKNFISPPQ